MSYGGYNGVAFAFVTFHIFLHIQSRLKIINFFIHFVWTPSPLPPHAGVERLYINEESNLGPLGFIFVSFCFLLSPIFVFIFYSFLCFCFFLQILLCFPKHMNICVHLGEHNSIVLRVFVFLHHLKRKIHVNFIYFTSIYK
jgi:hypothetical protein